MDPVAAAIRATEPEPEPGKSKVTLRYAEGRVGTVSLPNDLTPDEWVRTLAYLTSTVYPDMMKAQAEAAAEAAAAPHILVPTPRLVRPS